MWHISDVTQYCFYILQPKDLVTYKVLSNCLDFCHTGKLNLCSGEGVTLKYQKILYKWINLSKVVNLKLISPIKCLASGGYIIVHIQFESKPLEKWGSHNWYQSNGRTNRPCFLNDPRIIQTAEAVGTRGKEQDGDGGRGDELEDVNQNIYISSLPRLCCHEGNG